MSTGDDVRALAEGAALFDRSDRARLAVAGPDRAKFLHNLTTNDVKRLPIGRGCEAFVTSPQGKTLGYVSLLAADALVWLRTDPGALGAILPHLQKYGIFDDVAIDDRTDSTFELHLAGPRADEVVQALGAEPPGAAELDHRTTTLDDLAITLIREAPTGHPGLTVIGPAAEREAVAAALRRDVGVIDGPADLFEMLRIAAGTPAAGRDVTPDNLPQEVGRDRQAINFVKGCYLGQETVARLDALGHVNKLLKRLDIESPSPVPAGTPLLADDKTVGQVTSTSPSAAPGRLVALGYVRVAQANPGQELRLIVDGAERIARVL